MMRYRHVNSEDVVKICFIWIFINPCVFLLFLPIFSLFFFFYQICLAFLLKPSGTLAEIIAESSHVVRKKQEITGVAHPGWLLAIWPLDLSSSFLKKQSLARRINSFQNFVMIRITWGICTCSKCKFSNSFQTHSIQILRGGLGGMPLTKLPGDSYLSKDGNKKWMTPTAVLIQKFHYFLHIPWLIKYFNWSYGAWMEMVERRKNYSLYIKNDIEFGIFCEILKELYNTE